MHEKIQTTEIENPRFAEYVARQERILGVQEQRLPEIRERAEANFALWEARNPGDPQNQTRAFSSLRIAEQAMEKSKDKLQLARPTSIADIEYRKKVVKGLQPAIEAAIPEGLPLRFHGTPIYNVPAIMHGGGLSSSVDRLGGETSYDVADQVSVTTARTLDVTLQSYSGLLEEDCMLPAGCVFVLLPASKEEEAAGASMLMSNVDFAEHPEQLFGIMTSEENLPAMRQLAAETGIDPSKVHEFFEFPDYLARLDQAMQRGEVQLQDIVPYDIGK